MARLLREGLGARGLLHEEIGVEFAVVAGPHIRDGGANGPVHVGSTWNFIGGRTQSGQPLLNSECGNVWGYEGSTGDVDWSWDYHRMLNSFRRFPEVAGWLYTEHDEVINEWNGY